jgi:dTDP-4-dehydrorhamnose reductase
MKTLLVTGASGFLGRHFCAPVMKGWRLVGTYHRHPYPPVTNADVPLIPLDLTCKDTVWKMLKSLKPAAVVHLAANSGTNHCEEKPDETAQLNVEATADLAEMCADRHVKLIFTSSEQVFDGRKGTYRESDPAEPANEYGRQKLAAESLVSAICPDGAIVRLAVLFGFRQTPDAAGCFLDQWLASWKNSVPVTAFRDEIRSFLSVDCAVRGIVRLLDMDASGLFHLGGEVPMSRYDFAVLSKESFRLRHAVVLSRLQKEVIMAAYRPPDLSLDSGKLSDLGFRPEEPAHVLRRLAGIIRADPPFLEN